MTTEAKLLSDCGGEYVVDADYKVAIEAGDYLVVEVGAKAGKPAASFKYPNVAASMKKIYEFKHYHNSGRKSYTQKAGVSYFFVIPRSKVTLLPEKGYSYIPAEINGVKVTFSVSGGGCQKWTDVLNTETQISVGHKLSDIKKIAEVAVLGTGLEPVVVELSPADLIEWEKLSAKANPDVKSEIFGMVEKGLKPVIKLVSGYSHNGKSEGYALELNRGYKWHDLGAGRQTYKQDGAVKDILLAVDEWKIYAKVGMVDWAATAKANGVAA